MLMLKEVRDRLEYDQTHTKSLHLKLYSSTYLSFDTFSYSVMRENLDSWGEEFDHNYCHVIIQDPNYRHVIICSQLSSSCLSRYVWQSP